MSINAMIEGNTLTLTCGSKDEYDTIVECLHTAIEVIYKLKDTRETSPDGCLYKIANEHPKSLRLLIEDTAGKVDPETGHFKGIDQVLASLPPYILTKKDALPCMHSLGSASLKSAAEAIRLDTGFGSPIPPGP